MTTPDIGTAPGALSPQDLIAFERLCDRYEDALRAGTRMDLVDVLAEAPEGLRPVLFRELLVLDAAYRAPASHAAARDEYRARFPDYATMIEGVFRGNAETTGGYVPGQTPDPTDAPAERGPPDHDPEPRPLAIPGYELREQIGRGGMGVVYRATDLAFDREVAIKLLTPGLAGTPAAERFREEARITGRLQHPSIPPVHEVGTLGDGTPYLVMKLIRGRTLAEELASTGRPQRTAGPDRELRDAAADEEAAEQRDRLLRAFEQICHTVAFAHSRRFIHRDLKPGNVMLGAFGEVQVMDWGLAKSLADAGRVAAAAPGPAEPEFGDGPEERTRAGAVMGTPAYMAPEQARGRTTASTSARTCLPSAAS
ncbi:MAG: serine/threonine-protein kinase [Gemmataceae bacterium]